MRNLTSIQRTIGTIVSCCFLLIGTAPKAQSPGGVASTLTAWFKANTTNAANLVLNGTSVSAWNSEVNAYSTTQATASRQPVFVSSPNTNNSFNFNPSLQFEKATSKSLNNTNSTPDLLGTNGTTFMIVNTYNYSASSSSCFAYMSNSSYRYQIKAHFRIQTGNNSTGYTADFNPQFPTEYGDAAGRVLVIRSTGTDFYSKRNGEKFSINNAEPLYNPAVSTGLCIGSNNNGGGSEYTNSAIAELITYSTTLSDADINKVESYLAIKYGSTLNQSATYNNNYTSSVGTVIWDRTANSSYASNITGIGRDDVSGLLQKQSKSVNTAGLISLYNGNAAGVFPDMNVSNTSSFSADRSFVLIGDNGASTNFTSCSYKGKMPRMSRVWKVQKTGTVNTVTIAVNSTDVSSQVKNLIVSTDPTFPAASTTIYPLQTASGKFYMPVALSSNDYFTFATDSLIATFAEVQPSCTSPSSGSITATVSGGATPQTYSWNTSPIQTTATASNLSAGTYTLSITNSGGCVATYTPTALQAPQVITVAPTATPAEVCSGSPSTLNGNVTGASASATYTWMPGTLSGQSVTVNLTATTTYTLTVQDGACQVQGTATVTVKPIPTTTFTATPTPICLGTTNTVTYTGSAASSATYTWSFDGATVQAGTGAGPYTILFPTAGTKNIQLQVTDNGCASAVSTTQTVVVDQPPTVTFTTTPTAICQGQTVSTNFTGTAASSATFTWNWGGGSVQSGTGAGPFVTQYNTSGTITLTVTNGACTATSNPQNITVTPMPIASFTVDTVIGCNPLLVTFTNTSQNASAYNWAFGDGNTSSSTAATVSNSYTTGNYSATLTATQGSCTNTSAPKTITVLDKPIAAFVGTPNINTPIQLSFANFGFSNQSQNATNYVWLFGDNDTSFATSPTHKYQLPGIYTVKLYAINSIGCIDSTSNNPYMVIPDSTLKIPNAFSPNGDGINDKWEISGLNGYPNSKIEVFNRWGQPVYSSIGYSNPWNGMYKGSPLPVGTFYYVIVANNIKYAGWVMLLR